MCLTQENRAWKKKSEPLSGPHVNTEKMCLTNTNIGRRSTEP